MAHPTTNWGSVPETWRAEMPSIPLAKAVPTIDLAGIDRPAVVVDPTNRTAWWEAATCSTRMGLITPSLRVDLDHPPGFGYAWDLLMQMPGGLAALERILGVFDAGTAGVIQAMRLRKERGKITHADRMVVAKAWQWRLSTSGAGK